MMSEPRSTGWAGPSLWSSITGGVNHLIARWWNEPSTWALQDIQLELWHCASDVAVQGIDRQDKILDLLKEIGRRIQAGDLNGSDNQLFCAIGTAIRALSLELKDLPVMVENGQALRDWLLQVGQNLSQDEELQTLQQMMTFLQQEKTGYQQQLQALPSSIQPEESQALQTRRASTTASIRLTESRVAQLKTQQLAENLDVLTTYINNQRRMISAILRQLPQKPKWLVSYKGLKDPKDIAAANNQHCLAALLMLRQVAPKLQADDIQGIIGQYQQFTEKYPELNLGRTHQ